MNKIRISVFGLLIIIVVIIFLTACKTTRSIIKEPIKAEGADYLFRQLKNKEMKFNTLSAKFSATYIEDKKKTSFRGQMRIQRDSLIWISISPALGIEMIRVAISNDTVKYIDRIGSNYLVSDFNYINSFINSTMDFDMLQAFLIGNDFSFFENGKFKASIDGMEYRLTTAGRSKLKKYVKTSEEDIKIPIQNIWLDHETFKITRVMIKEVTDEGRKVIAVYSDFHKINEKLFPYKLGFQISSGNSIDIQVEYSKISVDKPLKFPFSIPEKYTKLQ